MLSRVLRPPLRRPVALFAVGSLVTGLLAWQVGSGTALVFFAAFVLTWWTVPPVVDLAHRLGAMVQPGGRSIHRRSTPVLGGTAIFIPLLLVLIDAGIAGDSRAWGLAGGCTLVFLLGALDDIRGVSPKAKILVQLLAGSIVIASGFRLEALSVPGMHPIALGALEIPFLLCWFVLATNAFNLIDGMDGLAASIAGVAALACFAVGAMPGPALVVAGATLGFLRYNLPRASIFMGDCGSMVLGFALSCFVLQAPAGANVPIVIAILAYPLGDVALAVLRRFVRGKPLFAGDRSHVHHKALEYLENSVPLALFAILLFTLSQTIMGVMHPSRLALAIIALMWAGLAALLVRGGHIRLAGLMAGRRPLRRLHLVHGYVMGAIGLADSRSDLELALRQMVEGLGLGSLRFRGLRIANRASVGTCQDHLVPLGRDEASWSGPSLDHDTTLADERDTVVVELIRTADRRWRILEPLPSGWDDSPRTLTVGGGAGS